MREKVKRESEAKGMGEKREKIITMKGGGGRGRDEGSEGEVKREMK